MRSASTLGCCACFKPSHCYCTSFRLVLFCSQLEADADEKGKYARRQGGLQRTMKRVFPGLFQGSLPVTTKWVPLPCLSTDAVLQCVGSVPGALPGQPAPHNQTRACGGHLVLHACTPMRLTLPLLACTLLALSSHCSACSAACRRLQH